MTAKLQKTIELFFCRKVFIIIYVYVTLQNLLFLLHLMIAELCESLLQAIYIFLDDDRS